MKRTLNILVVLAAFAGFASAANAAVSVVLSADKASYNFGETITLTTRVTNTDLTNDVAVFGVIEYAGSLGATPIGVSTQFPLPATTFIDLTAPGGPWNQALLPACTSIRCRNFSQTNAGGALPSISNFVIAQMQFTAGNTIGTANFVWQSAPVSQRLDFFGVTSAPGVSVSIVPEPTTAAMLGLGLFGLALAGRRRS